MRARCIKFYVAGFAAAMLALPAFADTIYVNLAATGNNNGSSWNDAYTTISSAISQAGDGDEIWVAKGTYKENLVSETNTPLRDGVRLLGGFAGNESDESERSPSQNITSIDGQRLGRVVEFDDNSSADTVLDGFHIRGGLSQDGGGIRISNGSRGTISNNVITENRATEDGGAIAVNDATPTIANNLIFANFGSSAGIFCIDYNGSYPTIVNNTIVNNPPDDTYGVAVRLRNHVTVTMYNNIVANNGPAIDRQDNAVLIFANNDVFGNDAPVFSGLSDPTGSNGNINQDPQFLSADAGDFRLMSVSPAVDTGDDTQVSGDVDLDSAARIQGAHIDMGAYERGATNKHLVFTAQPTTAISASFFDPQPLVQVMSRDGGPLAGYNGPVTISIDPGSAAPGVSLVGNTTVNAVNGVATFDGLAIVGVSTDVVLDASIPDGLPAQSKMFDVALYRLYVSKTGLDTNSGVDWAHAKKTVAGALPPAAPISSEVWVAKGTYTENLTITTAVGLYGGFSGTENQLSDRNLTANKTILDGGSTQTVITSVAGQTVRVIDGFTIQHGAAANGAGAALKGFLGTIANTEFINNTATGNGGGLFIDDTKINSANASVTLTNVKFTTNTAAQGGGMYLDASDNNPTLNVTHTAGTFSGNRATSGGALYFLGDEQLNSCTFTNNTASVGGAIYHFNTAVANSCVFTSNGITGSTIDAAGGAVYSGENAGLQSYGSQFTGNSVSAVAGKAAVGGAWAALTNGSLYAPNSSFTSNHAASGGAIYGMRAGNITLYACQVTDNTATGNGGGAYVAKGPFSAQESIFARNTAGGYGGALAFDTAPVGHDQSNQVYLLSNTISDNTATGGGAIDSRHYTEMRVLNSIVAFNSSGIQQDATSFSAFFRNDIYGNGSGTDFQGLATPVGTLGNISANPLFVNRAGGNYHLGAGSPAIDAGDTGPYAWYSTDLEGSRRVQGARADMGALESSGVPALFVNFDQNVAGGPAPGPLSVQPKVSVVDQNGSVQTSFAGSVTLSLKAGYGTTGATLGGTVTKPLVNGVATFSDITVDKGGTGYVITASISGHGGADSAEFTMTLPVVRVSATGSDNNDGASWAAPKRTLHATFDETAVDGSVWVKSGYYFGSQNPPRSFNLLGGFAGTETSDTQRNPKVNITTLDAGGLGSVLICYGQATDTPLYDGLTFTNGIGYGGGIQGNTSPTISNNVFTNNNTVFGGGILLFGTHGRITHNVFTNNLATLGGGGIYLSGSSADIDNNLFTGNSNTAQDGSAIVLGGSDSNVFNNTFVNNVGSQATVSLQSANGSFVNNIVVNNESGVSRSFGSTSTLVVKNNDVYNNTGFNYQNMVAGANDISANPLFVNATGGNFHLAAGSPAVDAGDDAFALRSVTDLDGNPRKQGTHADIGAYEVSVSGAFSLADVVRALRIAGGLASSLSTDMSKLNVENTTSSLGKIDLRDAERLARKVQGKDANP